MINIIIPCYNSNETLPNTLNSLIAQTQKKFFITIIDDCSQEPPDEIIKEYRDKLNIEYIKLRENVGSGMARQVGLDNNKMCEYILFLDSDDMLLPNAIEILNRESNLHKPDLLISSFIQQNKYGIDRIISAKNNLTWLHGKLYNYNFLKINNIRFTDKLRLNEDGSFNTMVTCLADKEKIFYTSVSTVLWVDNKQSLTRKNENFMLYSIPDFIYGQIKAFDFVINSGKFIKNKEQIAMGITYIYNYYQFYIYYKKNFSEEIDNIIKEFLNKKEIKDCLLYDKVFKKDICFGLQDKNTKNLLYFDTESFPKFLKKFSVEIGGIGDINESCNN